MAGFCLSSFGRCLYVIPCFLIAMTRLSDFGAWPARSNSGVFDIIEISATRRIFRSVPQRLRRGVESINSFVCRAAKVVRRCIGVFCDVNHKPARNAGTSHCMKLVLSGNRRTCRASQPDGITVARVVSTGVWQHYPAQSGHPGAIDPGRDDSRRRFGRTGSLRGVGHERLHFHKISPSRRPKRTAAPTMQCIYSSVSMASLQKREFY
jgi:hypothetical protein